MPYQNAELISNRVYYSEVAGHHTVDESREVADDVTSWVKDVNEPNGIFIINMENVQSLPLNIKAVRDIVINIYSNPNLAMTIVYGRGERQVIQFFANNIVKFFTKSIHICNTRDEVLNYISSQYPELADELSQTLPVNATI